jgi:hypothetical protein
MMMSCVFQVYFSTFEQRRFAAVPAEHILLEFSRAKLQLQPAADEESTLLSCITIQELST